MSLAELWFGIVAVFWTGFFVLEGFDFGVGMLHTIVGRDEDGRRVALNAIGPFWDGNEVWLIVAGAAIFAAFPAWYATLFSGLYLALLLVLVALIARGVSFEFRDKVRSPRWQRVWTWATILGSAVVPLVLGIGLGDLVAGLPVNSEQEFTGSFADIFTAYGIWTGITLLALCLLHVATFLGLTTAGPVRRRAHTVGVRLVVPAAVAALVFAIWSATLLSAVAFVCVVTAGLLLRRGREGWAFAASAAAMACTVASLF